MGASTRGLDELLADFETLPERAAEKFPRVLGQGGLQIKKDWRERWKLITGPRGHSHIPHLLYAVGYDVDEYRDHWRVKVGVAALNRQSFLAEIITYGTLTSAPHDAGQAALDDEDPRFVNAVAQAAQELLEGK